MNPLPSLNDARSARQAAGDEVAGLLIGTAFTFALFFGMAHFEYFGPAEPVAAIEDMQMATVPLEPPPPPPRTEERVPDEIPPLSGIEIAAADSPVSIAVLPPELANPVSGEMIPPRARIPTGLLYSDLKPKADVGLDIRHVYQEAEVDQLPRALVRTTPSFPPEVSSKASFLRVTLIVVINQEGKAESARVEQSSGNLLFDEIVAKTVQQEWLFSPAMRHGRKVRVMAKQGFRVVFSTRNSPFDIN